MRKDGESNQPGRTLPRRPRSFVHAAVAAAAALGHRLRRLRRRSSRPSWLVGALRRLRALALAPSLASDYSSTQLAAVSTTSCAARSSSAGARQVEERDRSHPRRAVRRPGWLPVAPAAGRSASAVRPELRGLTAPRSPRSSTSRWSRSTQGASPAHRTRPLRAPPTDLTNRLP